ncbi:MAG TPA: vitamin K epoxide reductase family protein [Sulfolobales archaeon]|nr:vitamin K epoxide reductase family protein [Sulfolobales archaeon]
MDRRMNKLVVSLMLPPIIGLIAAIASLLEQPGGGSVCDINSFISCSQVIYSRYSSFMGISLSIWAALYFTTAILIATTYLAVKKQTAMKIYWGISIAALPIIAILIYIEILVIKALCLYCTVMHISIITMSVVSTTYTARLGHNKSL